MFIVRHFTKNQIPRDLEAKIHAEADALMAVKIAAQNPTKRDLLVADKVALDIATVQINHRSDIHRFRNLCLSMLEELECTTHNNSLFHELGEMLRDEDDKGQDKRNDLYNKVISQSSRMSGLNSLASTLKSLVELERKVYRISDDDEQRQNNTTNIQINNNAEQIALVIDSLQNKY
ncbi:MAG: hypothetical protein V4440_08200 [Pseudomonadota bacterium]